MKILVAEDEKDLLYLIRDRLIREGHTVVTAQDGISAWNILKEESMELGIFDVMMPGMDGFQLLQKVREHSDMQVIFLTARTDEIDRLYGLSLGADDYLLKPFSMAELMARVQIQNRHLQKYKMMTETSKTQENDTEKIVCGELELNLLEAVLYKNKKEIPLLAKEISILKILMEHPGCVYTKKQLYRMVWEDSFLNDDNTVMVHISRIRAKIEDNPKEPEYLVTVRGVGYKMQKH